ncbi:MAG: di-heme enzyme [Candidatus Binatia bacterium]|nr:MAG: di-heme enzyme [Candidatus Binatia bacterium]
MLGTVSRARIPLVVGWLGVIATLVSGALAQEPTPYEFELPVGFPKPKVPANNPLTVEKIALGRFLFYDVRLSGNMTQSCASCHQQVRAFTDGRARAIGSTGEMHPRSAMSLANVAYATALGWANPLLDSLERQALVPMFNERPVELGLTGKEAELFDRLRADLRYQRMFAEAFPNEADPISLGNIVKAIASFERTLLSGNTPYDRYVQGLDDQAISEEAFLGGRLFFSERLECFHCHGGFNFTASVTHEGNPFDETSFQNNGLYNIDGRGAYPPDNTGLFEITGLPADMGRFKAPTLRNLSYTAPYMHDGSIATLEEVIEHYAAGGRTIHSGPYAGDGSKNPFKSNFVRGFTLTEEEKQQLLAFLRSLDDARFVSDPRLSNPFESWPCRGDCNYDEDVTIDEIVRSVNVALGTTSLALCLPSDASGEGEVTIDELLQGVRAVLEGCKSVVTVDVASGESSPPAQ